MSDLSGNLIFLGPILCQIFLNMELKTRDVALITSQLEKLKRIDPMRVEYYASVLKTVN